MGISEIMAAKRTVREVRVFQIRVNKVKKIFAHKSYIALRSFGAHASIRQTVTQTRML